MPRTTIFRSSLLRACVLALPCFLGAASALASQPPATSARTYTVKKGDTLWSIASELLGSASLWPQIYKLNTEAISDPRKIYPGLVLKLEAAPGQTTVPAKDTPAPLPPAPAPARDTTPVAPLPVPPQPTPPAPALEPEQGQGQAPSEAGMELFRRRRVASVSNAFETYREAKYHPLRSGEFYSAGFLSEDMVLPYGSLLGPTTPEQIESSRARAAVQILTKVAVAPPAGASYSVGDTLLVVDRREGPIGYGQIVAPTGLIKIDGANGAQMVGEVIAVYGPIRDGQSVLPGEKFADPGTVTYQPVKDGLWAQVLISRDRRELRIPQQILFLNAGRAEGVTLGDLFEARRTPGPQAHAMGDAVDELMAVLQVVHVGEHTCTVKVQNVVSPDIPVGTRARLVAKLPG